MHRFSIPLVLSLAVACAPADDTSEAGDASWDRMAKSSKADVCHWDSDAGAYTLLNVSTNSAHFDASKHGDDVDAGDYYEDADGDGAGAGAAADCPAWDSYSTDGSDAFPDDPDEDTDSDGDGIGDNSDACPDEAAGTDSDGDGCEDASSNLSCDCDVYDACSYYADGSVHSTYTIPKGNLATASSGSVTTLSGQDIEICEGAWSVYINQTNAADLVTVTGEGAGVTVLGNSFLGSEHANAGMVISDLSFEGDALASGGYAVYVTQGEVYLEDELVWHW